MTIDAVKVIGPISVVSVYAFLHGNRCNPNRVESHSLDVIQLIDDPLEVTAMPFARVRFVRGESPVIVVGGITVGKPVRHDEVDAFLLPVCGRQCLGGRGGTYP